jgi:hypothetical protein
MIINITNDVAEAINLMVERGGYEPGDLTVLSAWLERGDDVMVFSLADLSAIGSKLPLYWVMPWERDAETPRQAPDTAQTGLGWRYVPAVRVTAEVPA